MRNRNRSSMSIIFALLGLLMIPFVYAWNFFIGLTTKELKDGK